MAHSDPTSRSETRAGVTQLLAEYCTLLDMGNSLTPQRFSSTRDGWSWRDAFTGRAAVERFFTRSAARGPLCAAPALGMEGPVIAAISSFLFVDIATGSQVVGYYHDDLVRRGSASLRRSPDRDASGAAEFTIPIGLSAEVALNGDEVCRSRSEGALLGWVTSLS